MSECWRFYAVPTARVIFTAKTSLDIFSLSREQVWTFSVLGDQIYEMRCPFLAVGLYVALKCCLTGITCHRPTCLPDHSHYTDTRPTSYVLWSPLHHMKHASRDHSHFYSLWYDWTQHQLGNEPTKPPGRCYVPPIVVFYDHQGLLRTYSLPG